MSKTIEERIDCSYEYIKNLMEAMKMTAEQAFAKCQKLNKITMKSTNLKSVGKNAFQGVHKKVVFKVPKKKVKPYKKILKKGNLPKKAIIKQ